MNSFDAIINRSMPPSPWAEGDNIPWNEPAFSERMLAEHLTQDHDLASRISETIDAQTAWIHSSVLGGRPSTVLDLACGPGLYLNRLGARGHSGVGIDFSPASIRHATSEASAGGLNTSFVEGDLRETGFGTGFDVCLLLYGQINVFRRDEAAHIVRRAAAALQPGGILVVEPQAFDHVKTVGRSAPTWSSHASGLFSNEPHILLTESFWDDTQHCTTQRFHVVTGGECEGSSHAMTSEAYTDDEFRALLTEGGFHSVSLVDGFSGSSSDSLAAYVCSVGEIE